MFCLAKENEENGEQEADNEVDEEEEEGGEEEDEEEEGDGNFVCSPHPHSRRGVLLWTAGSPLDSQLLRSGGEQRAASPPRGCGQRAPASQARSFLACLSHRCWE